MQTNLEKLVSADVLNPAALSPQEIEVINALSPEEIDILRSGAKVEPHDHDDHQFPKVIF